MNEEIEYAEMLEIPVSTVNVVKKRGRKPKKSAALKDKVISKINEAAPEVVPAPAEPPETQPVAEEVAAAETAQEALPIFLPKETQEEKVKGILGKYKSFEYSDLDETPEESVRNRRSSIILGVEFAAACALCFGIFLTNVFVPNSAINTFFRSLTGSQQNVVDTRVYSDFTLSPVVQESDAELTLSETGILSFTKSCCVYPAANGKISAVSQATDGSFTVKINHSPTFTEVFTGLDYVAYSEGDEVKTNIPLGYSDGVGEVQVTMYESGELLNCFSLGADGEIVWNAVEE